MFINLNNILKYKSGTKVNTVKTKINRVLLPFITVALLFSVACDYASITAPEVIEAPINTNAIPADEINSGNDTLFKKGKKKNPSSDEDGGGSVGSQNNHPTRYGWGF